MLLNFIFLSVFLCFLSVFKLSYLLELETIYKWSEIFFNGLFTYMVIFSSLRVMMYSWTFVNHSRKKKKKKNKNRPQSLIVTCLLEESISEKRGGKALWRRESPISCLTMALTYSALSHDLITKSRTVKCLDPPNQWPSRWFGFKTKLPVL